MKSSETDILVIGGGPAGTTFATLMAQRGWKVALLEKGEHPRFHIGESLLPMNLPILERLGVLDQVRDIGIVKRGADFTQGNSGTEHQTFYFDQALGDSPGHAFEVTRSEFDGLLFANCRSSGVDAHEGVRATEVRDLGNGRHRVESMSADGESLEWTARFVVDASGRDALLASKNGWKRRNARHASAAIFGHFHGVRRRPRDDEGNISIYWFDHGWVWMIPLPDDVMSIGVVAYPQYLKTRKVSLDDFLMSTLKGVSEIGDRLSGAQLIRPAQATGNYSYFSSRSSGSGFLLIGDAYAFIDPVFSSGVYLAMSSAENAVPVAEAWLSGNRVRYYRSRRKYQRRLKQGISTFSWFIYRFTTPAMSHLLNNPDNRMKVVQAVTSMLAGDVYSNWTVRWRLMIFKGIYFVTSVRNWRGVQDNRRKRRAGVGVDLA
ncbi:MAG TPA: NAD(P)/FAD-dependent oxidoreductase [Xanthomonadales bacterium]|nr:NAD(P)/FAD-dependent oxidoreductase [Xanthomonadales bacterium]